jgi:hypothetical protein
MESRINLRIWRSVNVNVRLLLFCRRRGAAVCRWIDDSGIAFFLVRRINGRCLLLACSEQPQHSQQVNRFFHIPESYSTAIRSPHCRRYDCECLLNTFLDRAPLCAFDERRRAAPTPQRSKWVFGITAPDRQQLRKERARAFHSRSLVSSVGFWDASR